MATPNSLVLRSFVAGEMSPDLGGRADLARYVSGAKTLRNFLVQRQGGITKRPGLKWIAEVKTSAQQPKLLKFVFEGNDQSYVLEFGHLYVRFYWHRAQVMDPATPSIPYEVVTPYTAADVATLWADQETDTLVLTHPSYAIRELRRVSHDSWVLTTKTLGPSIAAPTNLAGSAPAAGTNALRYKVTAAKLDTYEESVGSATHTVSSTALPTEALPVALTWTAVSGAVEYYVYKDQFNNGVFGYIGTASTTTFYDPGFAPDHTITPPISKTVFASSSNYPAKACHYQQRHMFAATNTEREKVWGSRTAAYNNFSISTPLKDDDAIEFVISTRHLNPISWLVPLKRLVVFNDEGAYLANGDDQGTLTPATLNVDQVGYDGAHPNVEPVVVNQSILFVDDSAARVRHLTFNKENGGFDGGDKTIGVNHLFDGYSIVSLDFAKRPHSVVYAVRSDGKLLGFTYVPDQEVEAWHQHDTDGTVEQVIVVPSRPGDDDVYVLVNRTIGGATKRFIECFGPRWVPDVDAIEDAFFVDSGLSYDSAPATVFSGLAHLNGQRVAILGDGVVISDGRTGTAYTVSAGAVTLPASRSVVHIGLPMPYADLETLEIDVQGSGIRPIAKRVRSVVALLRSSRRGFYIGPDSSNLTLNGAEPWETATEVVTRQTEVITTAEWSEQGRLFLRHTDPLPFAINGLIPQMEFGA